MRKAVLGGAPPYVDVEMSFAAGADQVAFVRSVAAEIAASEAADRDYVERVRDVAGRLTVALLLLAERGASVHCLFRVLDGQVRVRMSVDAPSVPPSPEAKAQHARTLDELGASHGTFSRPGRPGAAEMVSDLLVD